MNERLRQLMVQADYPAPEIALRAQKLAELIVKECLMIVYERQVQAPTDDDGYFKVALDMVSKDIEQHFGVEE
jgi:hypothetical protein